MSNNPFNKGKRQLQADTKAVSPIFFYDTDKKGNYVVNPIYMLKDHPNDDTRFAILRTTENGKYVRGGMLYFSLNGVEIYTELNNVLFIDLNTKTVFIKQYDKVLEEITPVDPEKRQYIVMMSCTDNDENVFTWESMVGRSTMYNFIKDNVDVLGIDPEKSFVLTENVPYKDALTVSQFVKYLQNANYVEEDGFDIDEWTMN
jgi:hypothetical protein